MMMTGSRLFLLLVIAATLCAVTSSSNSRVEAGLQLIEWLEKQEDVQFNGKQELREVDNKRIGLFATKDIASGEVLSRVPWNLIIDYSREGREQDSEDDDGGDKAEALSSPNHSCTTFYNLVEELEAGADSSFKPFIDYLVSSQAKLPISFSENAQKLLSLILNLVGDEESPPLLESLLPPFIETEWLPDCDGQASSAEEIRALPLMVQYSFQKLLIPTYDFYAHRNGKWLNTEVHVVDNSHVEIVASRNIAIGEQLHGSFYECKECHRDDISDSVAGERILIPFQGELIPNEIEAPQFLYNYDVSLQYGEDDELHWEFSDPDYTLVLKENQDGEAVVEWDFDDSENSMDYLTSFEGQQLGKELRRIKRIRNIEWIKPPSTYQIPQDEWDSIWAFHQAYQFALEAAVKDIGIIEATEIEGNEHYSPLRSYPDATVYNELDCESSELIDFMNYEEFETKQSNYQTMLWQKRDDDTCLHLDDMLQICSSYRPHYHEFFVHFPAQYVENVRRVIFLGSGDAMLLHEILKYPELEKVVGLELDQDITRTSFRYFQTQPHYDDPRVEWWYGDATKTLPLLPKDYWASFDLVLVDLSETVVSMDVTGKHDILDVLENLLKPEGVILENELYIDKFMDHFDHTIHIFYGSPKVCTQVLTLSSNKVDFLHHPIKDHGVEAYLVKPPKDDEDRFRYIHDYVKRDATEEECSKMSKGEVVQGRTAGILEVVNYEDVLLVPEKNMEQTLFSIVRKHGFIPLSVPKVTIDNVAVVVMAEGYVLVRSWPEKRYCAVDIHLWGKFSKRNDVRLALREAFQSETVSDYRIVVGGMYGSTSLESDEDEMGVRFFQNRNCDESKIVPEDALVNQTTLEILSEETLALLEGRKIVLAVVCGFDGQDDCIASKMGLNVDALLTVWTCPELSSYDNSIDAKSMFECERRVMEQLEDSPPLDMILFDDSVWLPMFQIFDSILSIPSNLNQILKPRHVLATSVTPESRFKMTFVSDNHRQRVRKNVISAATFRIHSHEDDDNETSAWSVAYAGDEHSLHRLAQLENRIQTRLPALGIEIRSIIGGKKHSQKDLEYERWTFAPEKYDAKPSIEQYQNQEPVGRHSVFQLHWSDPSASFYKSLELLESTLLKLNIRPARFDTFKEVGDGVVAVAVYKEGSATMVWDGKEHLVVNMFSFQQDKHIADSFIQTMMGLSGNTLKVALRDDQPRGVGRVMNFSNEIKLDGNTRADGRTEEL
eukprot:scaffold781_cov132-Cylindrotheca_fusiformis.AAC.22